MEDKSIRIDPEVYKILKEIAIKEERSIKTVIKLAIENYKRRSK